MLFLNAENFASPSETEQLVSRWCLNSRCSYGFVLRMLTLKRITIADFLAASLNLTWQFHREYEKGVQSQQLYEKYQIIACTMGPAHHEIARMQIEFLLILAAIGSRRKGLKNTLLSVIGLSGVLIVYIFWWQYIFRIMEASGARAEAVPNFAYLAGGNFLDVVVAASVVILVLLNVGREALLPFRLNTD
jgi:hypothetical protein